MPNDLDLLALKAEALEAMRLRKDPNYPQAYKLFTFERDQWVKDLTDKMVKDFAYGTKR